MAHTNERAVAGRTSGRIGLGETVTWRARHFGITWSLTSRIVVADAPTRFVDEQVRGPFRSFRHEHRFEASGGGDASSTDLASTSRRSDHSVGSSIGSSSSGTCADCSRRGTGC